MYIYIHFVDFPWHLFSLIDVHHNSNTTQKNIERKRKKVCSWSITLVRRDERDFILNKTKQKENNRRRDLFENDNDPPPIINMKSAYHQHKKLQRNIIHQARAAAQLFRPWRYIYIT
jgi:hypothetical protein